MDLRLKINPILMTCFVVILTPLKHAYGLVPQAGNTTFIVATGKVAESV